MKINIFKKGVKTLNSATKTYVVSWWSRWGGFHGEEEKRYQAFTNKDDAVAFKEAIERAHKLIGNTYHSKAKIEEHKCGLPFEEGDEKDEQV